MATAKEGSGKTSLCSSACKEKLRRFTEEWKNNFKMCYCPCKINTYDSDTEETTSADNETTFLLHKKVNSEEVIKEESKVSVYVRT